MKKFFTLFVAAFLGLCAFAEINPEYGPCPSELRFALLNADNPAQVEIELQLINSSLNLNGFNMIVEKAEGSEALQWKKVSRKNFTAAGYGPTILAGWEGVTDEEREAILLEFCDVQSNVNPEGKLVIIELLKTNECRFFPILAEPAGIGKFWLDMSACADGTYKIIAPDTPQGCSFSYVGGAEPLNAWWVSDAPVEIELRKIGNIITSSDENYDFDFMVNGICYKINDDNASVTVTCQNLSSPSYSSLSGGISIPTNVYYDGKRYPVTSIGSYAFCGCSGLTLVTIPNSVTLIGSAAFSGCSGLTSVTISNSVTSIGGGAFYGCSGLTSVTIPNSVTTIGYGAFSGCSGLTSVTIPNSVTTIGYGAFSGCTSLTSVTWKAKNCSDFSSSSYTPFNGLTGITSFVFGNEVKHIPAYLCYGLTGLSSVTIPNSVKTIGKAAFRGCSGLTSVTIPNSVTSIGEYAFYGCSGLIEVTIPNSVTSIGNYAFSFCSDLTSVTIGNSVTSIGSEAFRDCSGLTSVTIPNSVTSIGDAAFNGCSGLTGVTWNAKNCSNSSSSYSPFNNCVVSTFVFGNEVETIPEYLCNYLSGLTSVTIPNSVKTIGKAAFRGCSGLTSVTIPNSVTTIGYGAFSGCTGLTSLTLTGQGACNPKNTMESVYSQLKTVNIGCRITSLGNFGFIPDVVNCYAEVPPTCSSGTFTNYNAQLHVPSVSTASYFMADYWQNFNMVNDLTEKVTLDKTNANLIQWGTMSLTATVIPEGSDVLWSSSNPSVAIVDENGIVTATGDGECYIFATLASNSAVYAWCHISSSYPEISILLSNEDLELKMGDEYELTAIITPDNTGLTPTWSSSNTNVATVNNGVVRAVGQGECDITASVLDKTATCHVTVDDNVSITLNIDNAIMGASQMLTVYPTCTPDVPVELVVTSSDPSVAVARVVNRTNAPAEDLLSFPEKEMAFAYFNSLEGSFTKAPAFASEKAITIVGVKNGTASIIVNTADGKATPAVLDLRVVDVNGDCNITASDITKLYDYLLNGDMTYYNTSDINGDGNITAADVTAIYDILLGNSPSSPSNVVKYTVNGVTFKMVRVVGGTFTMGATAEQGSDAADDETPAHQVTLSGFSIGQTEVTQELWQAVMGNNPSASNSGNYGTNLKRPVESVSWNECQAFIAKLNQLTGKNFRLPTEAEWEYAARGGKSSQGYKYAGGNNVDDVAWYWSNIPSQTHGSAGYGTQTVATKAPNELGIYDMSGNAWEWCLDWYGDYSSGAQTNPTGPESNTDSHRVARGGGWRSNANKCRVSTRNHWGIDAQSPYVGLRLAQ